MHWFITGKQDKQEVTGSLGKPIHPEYDHYTRKQFIGEANNLVPMGTLGNILEPNFVSRNMSRTNESEPLLRDREVLHAVMNSDNSYFLSPWKQDTTRPAISSGPPRTNSLDTFSVEGPNYPPNVHYLVRNIDTKARACAYCRKIGNKTSCGWYIKSYYHCNLCDVPLCSGVRGCFDRYHQMMKESGRPDIVWSNTYKKLT